MACAEKKFTENSWNILANRDENVWLTPCPYSEALKQKTIDREATIRTEWQCSLQDNGDNLKKENKYSEHKPCRYLAVETIPTILEGVIALLNRLTIRTARVDKANIELLSRLPWMQFSAIAFTNLLNSAIKNDKLETAIEKIAGACEIEARWEHYKAREKNFFDKILDQQHKSGQNTHHIDTVLKVCYNRKAAGLYGNEKDATIAWANWPKGKHSFGNWLGSTLIDIIIQTTGLFKTENDHYTKKNNNTNKRLYTTKKFDNYIADTQTKIGLLGGYYLPLPIPPRDWTTTQCGGFWTKYAGQKKLIKNWSKGYQEEMLNYTDQLMQIVFPAVNAAQHTAWRINQEVLEVLEALRNEKKAIAGLPAHVDPEVPVCPKCGKVVEKNHVCFIDDKKAEKDEYVTSLKLEGKDMKEINKALEKKFGPDYLRIWKMAASDVYHRRQSLKSLRLSLKLGLEVADILAGDERFYYVYQTDFRGRLYALGILNPQGTDWQKGILEFADGVELGEHGSKWLAIHVCNTWGNDKVSYSERVKWVKDNEQMILDCAAHPLDCMGWTEADSPFCFLAACMEWAGYKREGNSYKSHIPVALDGSCSGIQHYSAMLRDEVGAIATNVKCVDAEAGKHDIYGEVAKATNELIAKDIAKADVGEIASFILANKLIDRSTVKRAVMTLPYGSRFQSCNYYVSAKLMETLETMNVTDKASVKAYCDYTTKKVWDAIPLVVQAARHGMSYLQRLASLFTKQELPITWTTPTGFIVQQSYYSVVGKRLYITTGGSIVLKNGIPVWDVKSTTNRSRVTYNDTDARKIDPVKQVSGIAPNFIHSLDASHLMFSVKTAKENDIHNFALIHDSLGVHAGKTETFSRILRDSFYHLYKDNDPLKDITNHLLDQVEDKKLKKKAPEMPEKGKLDIEDVKTAIYLFS